MAVKKRKHNQSGQALFEFIVFLPFIFMLYLVMVSTGAAINGSINQQKATRGFFYTWIRNNSKTPEVNELEYWADKSLTNIGFYSIGWQNDSLDLQPVAACYRLQNFFGDDEGETCPDTPPKPDKALFIRLQTVYGFCTVNINIQNRTTFTESMAAAATLGACSVTEGI